MTVKDLQEALNDLPDDASVELSKFLTLDTSKEPPDAYEARLDFPIIGLAHDQKSGDVLFVVGGDGKQELAWIMEFSKDVRKIN